MGDRPVTIFHLEIPLRRPFETALGTIKHRSLALVRVGDEPFGWGEAAPYPGQDEPIDEVLKAARQGERTPTLHAALDEATADLQARLRGVSLSPCIEAARETVPMSMAVGLSDAIGVVEGFVAQGIHRFKLKVRPGRLHHVADIRSAHPDVIIGLDANGSFGADTVGGLAALADLDITYLEQPVADLGSDAARELRSMVDAPIFADESIRSVSDAEAVLELEHIDGVVVKPGRLGWTGALDIRALANASGKLWRASGLLETGIGRAYTDTLAACADAFVSDVAPASWFLEDDVAPLRHVEGSLLSPRGPGLGVEPDMDLIDRYLVERVDLG